VRKAVEEVLVGSLRGVGLVVRRLFRASGRRLRLGR
jgi:hypothetical protein